MKRTALVPRSWPRLGLAGCGSTGWLPPARSPLGRRARPAGPPQHRRHRRPPRRRVTDTCGERERELSKARQIDPRSCAAPQRAARASAPATRAPTPTMHARRGQPRDGRRRHALPAQRRARRPRPDASRSTASSQRAALGHGSDMVDQPATSPTTGPTAPSPPPRIRATGYLSSAGAWRIGENLAWGTGDLATPKLIMAAWMARPATARTSCAAVPRDRLRRPRRQPEQHATAGRDLRHRVRLHRPHRTTSRSRTQHQQPARARRPRRPEGPSSRRARPKARVRARRSRARKARARLALAPRSPPRAHRRLRRRPARRPIGSRRPLRAYTRAEPVVRSQGVPHGFLCPARPVLVVANRTAATPALHRRRARRAERGPAHFTLLVPNIFAAA